MKRGSHTQTILISFVGTNDAGKLKGDSDGAVLTVFKKRKFDEVHLIWNTSEARNISFEHIAKYVKSEIVKVEVTNTC